MLPALVLLACASHLATTPIPEATPTDGASTPASPEAGGPVPLDPPATLVAEPCTPRPYVREIVLEPGSRFTARDLVSPCPPNVLCVWSGIVVRTGNATWHDGALALEVTVRVDGPPGAPFPDRLVPAGPGTYHDADGCPYRVQTEGPR